jgi:hypothetical protein
MPEDRSLKATINPTSDVSESEQAVTRGCGISPELPACAIVISGPRGT